MKRFNSGLIHEHVKEVFELKTENEFIFIKSWAEGNVLEPDNVLEYKLLKNIIWKLVYMFKYLFLFTTIFDSGQS